MAISRSAGGFITLGFAVLIAACEKRAPPPPPRTATPRAVGAAPRDTSPPTQVAARASSWDSSAGSFLVVRESAPAPDSTALVVFPLIDDSMSVDSVQFDLSTVRSAHVDLFSRRGAAGSARISSVSVEDWRDAECTQWPLATLVGDSSARSGNGWTAGFLRGHVQPLPLDSIAASSPGDSARLAAEITRVASALPYDTATLFRGLPFVVRDAYRFPAAPKVEGVIAIIVRKLNQEASPREQHLLLIAERDSGDAAGEYRPVYFDRESGREEAIDVTDIIVGIRLGTTRHAAFLLLREGYESGSYSLLERSGPRTWGIRWTSAHTGC